MLGWIRRLVHGRSSDEPTDSELALERTRKAREQAEARGRHWIAKEGWVVVGVKQWRPVDVDAETTGPDAEYILEAMRADGSIVFHRWTPANEARAD